MHKNAPRIVCLLILGLSVYASPTSIFADIIKNYNNNIEQAKQNVLNWDFNAEVNTFLGFNLDTNVFGMESGAKINLLTTIKDKSDEFIQKTEEFGGSIQIKDLEIKIDYLDDYNDTGAKSETIPIKISWGDIEGTVFLGPFYVLLNYNIHDRMDLVDTLEDDDLSFSNINYSLIKIRETANYVGSFSNSVGATIGQFIVDSERGLVGEDFIEEANGSVVAGLTLIDKMIDFRIGASTSKGIRQQIYTDYNPFVLSSRFKIHLDDFNTLSDFEFILKGSASSGLNNRQFLEEDNPLFLGTLMKYRIAVFGGRFGITTGLGLETRLEHRTRVNPTVNIGGNPINSEANDNLFTQAYELASGIVLDWKNEGLSQNKDNHLDFKKGSNDIVTDGLGLSLGFGYVPNEVFREIKSPYLGLKITLWDSEDETGSNDRCGIIPNLETAIIFNFNHSFGGEIRDFHKYISGEYSNVNNSYMKIAERTDYAIGGQFKYKLAYLRPYFDILFKHLDIFSTVDINEVGTTKIQEARYYDNKADLRLKIGTKLVGLIHHVELEGYWQSGDLIKDLVVRKEFVDADFFSNENASGSSIFVSHAKFGYIALGARVIF